MTDSLPKGTSNLEEHALRLHELLTEPERMRRLFTEAPQRDLSEVEDEYADFLDERFSEPEFFKRAMGTTGEMTKARREEDD